MPLGVVAVEQAVRGAPVHGGGQLPTQVHRVLDAQVEPLPAGRQVDVRGIPGEQHPPVPVRRDLAAGVAEAGAPAQPPEHRIRAVHRGQRPGHLVGGHRCGAVLLTGIAQAGVDSAEHRPVTGNPPALVVQRVQQHPVATAGAGQRADVRGGARHRVRRAGQLDVGTDRGHPAGPPRERHAGDLADRAVPAVAGHQVAGAQAPGAVRVGDDRLDPVLVLDEVGQHRAPSHLRAQLAQPPFEHLLQPVLRDQQPVRVAGAPGTRVQWHRQPGEVTTHRLAPHGPVGHLVQQPAGGQHLRGARVHPTPAGLAARRGLLLQHADADAGQGQLGGQHQSGRARADHDHLTVVHTGSINRPSAIFNSV